MFLRNLTSILLIILVYLNPAYGAFEEKPASARSLSLGDANTSLCTESSNLFTNPASLGFISKKELQLSWSQLYGLKELTSGDFYFSFPLNKQLTLGMGYNIFGKNDYYTESLVIIGLGMKMNEYLSAGTNLKYYQLSFPAPYGDHHTAGFDIGSQLNLKEKVRLGVALKNINQAELIKDSEIIPFSYSLGISLYPYKNILLTADLYKTRDQDEELKFGQEIKPLPGLFLRFGMKPSPACYSLGSGLEIEKLKFDYGYLSHPTLGGSHKLTLSLDF